LYPPNLQLIEGLTAELATAPTVRVERNRYGYTVTDGDSEMFYRRTTTLLSGYPKPALVGWGIKMVAEYAWKHRESLVNLDKAGAIKALKNSPYEMRDGRAIRGTHIHNAIESLSNGLGYPEDLTDDERYCVEAVEEMLAKRNTKTLASEVIGFNNVVGYAGTFDHWEIDKATGETWLLDWKTSKAVYVEQSIQMSAYQNFTHIVLDMKKVKSAKEGTEIWEGKVVKWLPEYAMRLGVVHVEPHQATIYPIIPEVADDLFKTYRASAYIKNFMLDTDSYRGKTPRKNVYQSPIEYGAKLHDEN